MINSPHPKRPLAHNGGSLHHFIAPIKTASSPQPTKQAGRPTNQSLQKCSSAGCPSTVHCRRHTLLTKEPGAASTCTTRVSLAGNVRQACSLQAAPLALLLVLGLETELRHGNLLHKDSVLLAKLLLFVNKPIRFFMQGVGRSFFCCC